MSVAKEELWVPRPMNFGERLLEVRCVKLRLTQEKMASVLGVKRATLATWEKGSLPRDAADIAARYQEAFGISRTWLLFGDSDQVVRGTGWDTGWAGEERRLGPSLFFVGEDRRELERELQVA